MVRSILLIIFSFFLFCAVGLSESVNVMIILNDASSGGPITGAEIIIDGNVWGFTNSEGKLYIEGLESGQKQIRISHSSYITFSEMTSISSVSGILNFNLSPIRNVSPPPEERQPESSIGSILLDTNVASADVYINGELYGMTNSDGDLLISHAAGAIELAIIKKRYRTYSTSLEVVPGIATPIVVTIDSEDTDTQGGSSFLFVLIIIILFLGVGALAVVIFKTIRGIDSGTQKGTFDRYLIKATIGIGNMATVYKAKDTSNGQIIALKIIKEEILKDSDLVRKFFQEGQSVMAMNKKNPDLPLVKVYRYGREFGKEDGRPFISMKFYPGETLLDKKKRVGTFSIEESIGIIREICIALDTSHSLGVYHRDLSPKNVMLVNNSENIWKTRLIDFGVAKHEYAPIGTIPGTAMGTREYMAPEIWKGESIDNRADIYSLGIMFYEMLSGKPPFTSNNLVELIQMHESAEVPPLPDSIPESIKKLILKMLSKNRTDRPRNVNEVIKSLSKY